MANTEQLHYQTDKSNHRCSISCSRIYLKVHSKKPVLESHFHKVADLQACNFIKNRLQRRCFPVAKILRNTYFTSELTFTK